jgi:hypothetical protein
MDILLLNDKNNSEMLDILFELKKILGRLTNLSLTDKILKLLDHMS